MIELFTANVLIIWGIYASTRVGMIPSFIRRWVFGNDRYTEYLALYESLQEYKMKLRWHEKWVLECPPCMSLLYGTLFCLLVFPAEAYWWLPLWVFSLTGANYLINKMIQ